VGDYQGEEACSAPCSLEQSQSLSTLEDCGVSRCHDSGYLEVQEESIDRLG